MYIAARSQVDDLAHVLKFHLYISDLSIFQFSSKHDLETDWGLV